MKIDFSAEAPFSIKEDIDNLHYLFFQALGTYGYILFFGTIFLLLAYACGWPSAKSAQSQFISQEESKRANEERMKRVRRMQVGDTLEKAVQKRREDVLLRNVKTGL